MPSYWAGDICSRGHVAKATLLMLVGPDHFAALGERLLVRRLGRAADRALPGVREKGEGHPVPVLGSIVPEGSPWQPPPARGRLWSIESARKNRGSG